MGELGKQVAVALVEAVGVEACAAGGDAEDGESALPCPLLNVFAESEADLAIAVAIFDDESTDESVGRGLEMMLDGGFDPADDFVCEAGDEGGLVFGASRT